MTLVELSEAQDVKSQRQHKACDCNSATDVINGNVACATVMTYNEYWDLIAQGVPTSDLILINPAIVSISATVTASK